MKIPVYEPRNSIPGPDIRTPHASADAFGAQIGQATKEFGKTLASTMQSISSDFKEYQDKADASNAGFALSDAETTASVETMKAEHETPPDQMGGYAERRRARDAEIGQEMLAKVPPSQQQRAQLHWQNYSKRSYLRSYEYEQKGSEGHWASRIDEQAGKSAAALENAPDDLAAARLRLEEQIAELPRMPDWKKRQLLGRAMPILVHGAMQGYEKKLDGDPTRPESRPIGRQRDDIFLQMQNLRKGMDEWGTDHDTRSRSDAESVVKHAQNLGISPRDYAAIMSYETGGSMNPDQPGGVNKDGSGKGSFLGLIQMSPESQRKYNVKPGMTFDEQMTANSAYLKDRGLKPGHGLAEIYSIINTGSLDKSGQPRWDEPDVNGTLREKIGKITKDHYPRADKFLGEVKDTLGPVQTSMPALTPIRTASGKEVTVAGEHAEQFKGFLEDYERTGGDISAIGGYNVRNIAGTNTPSLHSFGRAIDINQGGRNVPISGKQFHPLGVKHEEQLAAKWGLIAGSTWGNPDRGHFEVRNAPGAVAARKHPFLGAAHQDQAGSGGTEGRVQIAQAGGAPVAGSAPMPGGTPVPGMQSKERAAFGKQMDTIINRAVSKAHAGDDAERKAVTDLITNDTVQIKMTGKDTELNAMRVERAFGPQFAEQWNNERQASRDFHAATVGMEHLSETDRRGRVQKLLPEAGAPGFARRAKLYEEANTKAEAISKSQKDSQDKFKNDMLKELYKLRSENGLKREHVEVAKSFVSPAEYEGLLNSLRAGAKVDDASAVRDLQDNIELPMPEFLQLAGRHLKEERIKTETFGSYIEKNRTLKRDDMPRSPSLAAREFIDEKHKPVLGSSQTVDRLLQDAKPTALRAFDDWSAENPQATRAEAFKVADEIVANSQNNIFRGLTFGLPLPRYLTGKTRDTMTPDDIINATEKLEADRTKNKISDADYQTQAGMLKAWFDAVSRNPAVKPAQSKPSAPSQAPPGAPGYKPTRKE